MRPFEELLAELPTHAILTDSGEVVTTETRLREIFGLAGPVAAHDEAESPENAELASAILASALDQKTLDALTAAGFDRPSKLAAATDEELRAVPGIGQATLAKVRAAYPFEAANGGAEGKADEGGETSADEKAGE